MLPDVMLAGGNVGKRPVYIEYRNFLHRHIILSGFPAKVIQATYVQIFTAKIYKLGINPAVDPPNDVLDSLFESAGKDKGPIPVYGTIDGADFTQTLVKFQGKWRLYVNGEMLRASGAKIGDEIRVEIEFDSRPREVSMPARLREALKLDKRAKIAFAELTPSRQKEIFKYINSLRTEASIARNVEKILQQLKGKIVEKPLVVVKAARKKS